MKIKKGALILIIIMFLITALQFVNAGIIEKIFGEKPQKGPVQITATLQNVPPTIVPSATGVGGFAPPPSPLQPQPYTPIAGASTATYNLVFIAEDGNGAGDLPNIVAANPTGVISGGIGAPLSSVNPTMNLQFNTCTSIDCQTSAPLPGPLPFPPCGTQNIQNKKAYVCGGNIPYYAPPSTYSAATPNANNLWRIAVTIVDIAGNPSQVVQSGMPGFSNLPNSYMQINAVNAANFPSPTIGFSSLSLTTPNQPSNSPLNIQNNGNVPLPTVTVTGSNLAGVNYPSSILSAGAFSVSGNIGGVPPAQCNVPLTATPLQTGIAVTVPNANIPYTAQGAAIDNTNLGFCAYQQLNTPGVITGTPVDTTYSGSWTVIA